MFLVTGRFKADLVNAKVTGVRFSSCEALKSLQYDELSERTDFPEFFVLEPVGKRSEDDVVYHSQTDLIASRKFIDLLQRRDSLGCVITEVEA